MIAVDYGYDHILDTLLESGTKINGRYINNFFEYLLC